MTIKHLVIPGGGPMGFKALGALQHLEITGFWNINDIKSIYATSAGAIISVLLSLKFDWESINDYILLRPWHETYSVNINQIFDAYSKKGLFDENSINTFFKPFFDTKDLQLTMTMVEFYEYTNIELHFFSLEVNSFEVVDINYKTFPDIPVIRAVHMSCAIPMIITPVCFDNKCFVDGGVASNYPIKFCIENEKNLNEIFGIKNIYNENENNIVNNESTMLDYVMHFIINQIVKNSNNYSYTGALPYEMHYSADNISLSNFKEALYSSDLRKKILDDGIQCAKDFLSKLEMMKDVDKENAL